MELPGSWTGETDIILELVHYTRYILTELLKEKFAGPGNINKNNNRFLGV